MKDESVVNVSINFKKWCTFARIAWNAERLLFFMDSQEFSVCVLCENDDRHVDTQRISRMRCANVSGWAAEVGNGAHPIKSTNNGTHITFG